MKKRYLLIALILMFMGIKYSEALVIGDCKVLVSFKKYSSLDETKYVCKGEVFGKSTDDIFYSGQGNIINLNNFNGYYFTNYDDLDITLNITGTNNISLLHINKGNLTITGKGSLKFKEDSFVKKVSNGEAIYQVEYKGKVIVDKNKKIYEGTVKEFENAYLELLSYNKLPDVYNEDDYVFVSVADYKKMTSVVVTESWIKKHIKTSLEIAIENGFGVIRYVDTKNSVDNKTLTKDNVVLISDKEVNSKYELAVNDLKEEEIGQKVQGLLEDLKLVGFYDLAVYNGKKEVSMKNGVYTRKIKLMEDVSLYDDLKIIYVADSGNIEEYIDAYVEDGYIVFNTSHLSHYGIIGTQKAIDVNIETGSNESIVGDILKISILVVISLLAVGVIIFLVIKGNLWPKKKKRRKVRA